MSRETTSELVRCAIFVHAETGNFSSRLEIELASLETIAVRLLRIRSPSRLTTPR